MADVVEIIEYMKTLKRGFDKDLFESKVQELSYKVDCDGLNYDDFHTLFKVWLNLAIPFTKWVSIGVCLVPQEIVKEKTIDYALRWILANSKQSSYSRIAFVLDWFTAAMGHQGIDMGALDYGYGIFFSLFMCEVLTPHALKLVYTLTKPSDVYRTAVEDLLDCARAIEGKKNIHRQIQVLLGLFKSYKPECVPEAVPMISRSACFKKINANLLHRFAANQNRRDSNLMIEKQHLSWINPVKSEKGKGKKLDSLVPDLEFCRIGSNQYDNNKLDNYFSFTNPTDLLQYSAQHKMMRPAQLRALLCNDTGLILLALASDNDQAFFSHNLHHILTTCFLEGSKHSYLEKQVLLQRVVALQQTLMQGIPVVTKFLMEFLPFWNEYDYFHEILHLVEWLNLESAEEVTSIVDSLSKVFHRAQSLEQCVILRAVTQLYINLVYASTRRRQYFMSMSLPPKCYSRVLPLVAAQISDMCSKVFQTNPDDIRLNICASSCWRRMASMEVWCERQSRGEERGVSALPLPPVACVAAALLGTSAMLLEQIAAIIILYKKIYLSPSNKTRTDQAYVENMQILKKYIYDVVSCLREENIFADRDTGMLFSKMTTKCVKLISEEIPNVQSSYSIKNHLAFAPYTYMSLEVSDRHISNEMWLCRVINDEFKNLSRFFKKLNI